MNHAQKACTHSIVGLVNDPIPRRPINEAEESIEAREQEVFSNT